MTIPLRTLDDLLAALRNAPAVSYSDEDGPALLAEHRAYAERRGLPLGSDGRIDYGELPAFGGDAPADTAGVWSWDDTRLLVGAGRDDLRIIRRG